MKLLPVSGNVNGMYLSLWYHLFLSILPISHHIQLLLNQTLTTPLCTLPHVVSYTLNSCAANHESLHERCLCFFLSTKALPMQDLRFRISSLSSQALGMVFARKETWWHEQGSLMVGFIYSHYYGKKEAFLCEDIPSSDYRSARSPHDACCLKRRILFA